MKNNIKTRRVITGYSERKGEKYHTKKGTVTIKDIISSGRYIRT